MYSKLRSYLLYNANQNNKDSISGILRKKRFAFFAGFCSKLKKPVSIIDLGGSDYHWRNSRFRDNLNFHITIVNTEQQNINDIRNLCFIKKDIRDLKFFDNREFDIVYSNSLFEHINNFDEQKILASEIQRIGKHYFIQTPNYYFPVEPHFLFPFFQFMSEGMKKKLIMKMDLGWYKKQDDEKKAAELAQSIRLLKKSELMKMFPHGKLYKEKYFLLNKSFIIYS